MTKAAMLHKLVMRRAHQGLFLHMVKKAVEAHLFLGICCLLPQVLAHFLQHLAPLLQ
jgi:hypothetical protein